MPLLDSYGQNIPFPLQTDKPNARTFGESLVEAVAPKTVMTFPSQSVRNATITSPRGGMMTWIEDIRQMQVYNGSAWTVLAAGTNAWTNISMSAGYPFTSDVNNELGRPQYRVVEMFGAQSLMLRGGFSVIYQSNGHAPNNREITNPPLPVHARPTTRRTVPLATSVLGGSDPTVKLDINTDGSLLLWNIGPNNQPQWISLDNVNVSL